MLAAYALSQRGSPSEIQTRDGVVRHARREESASRSGFVLFSQPKSHSKISLVANPEHLAEEDLENSRLGSFLSAGAPCVGLNGTESAVQKESA